MSNLNIMSARSKIFFLLSLSLSLSISSCNSAKNPSKENFTQVINESIKDDSGACLYNAYYPKRYDAYRLVKKNDKELKASQALERMGLLTSKKVDYTQQYSQSDPRFAFAYILGSKKEIGQEFTLTEKGQKYATFEPDKTSAICYSRGAEVSRIMNFTEPADKDGQKVTFVTYRYKYKNIPEWAKDPDVMAEISTIKEVYDKKDSPFDPFGEMQLTRTFKLTNEGWMLVGKGTLSGKENYLRLIDRL
jgi:hypothetical protein